MNNNKNIADVLAEELAKSGFGLAAEPQGEDMATTEAAGAAEGEVDAGSNQASDEPSEPASEVTSEPSGSEAGQARATEGSEGYIPSARKVRECSAAIASAKAPKDLDDNLSMGSFPHVRLKMTKQGPEIVGLLSTVENTQHLLDGYGITCRYNEMSRRIELDIPGMKFTSDNKANAAVSHIKSLARRNGLPVSEIAEYIVAIAEANKYHPVRDWIESKPWDGVSRLQDLCDTLVVDYEHLEHRDAVLRRWLISAVAAAFCDTPEKFEGCLTLQGEQGIGKTSFLLSLAPSSMGAVLDGFNLDPDNKDSVLHFNAHWIVELGELDGVFRKSDIAKLKAFISKKDDALRRAYAAMESFYKRRTVSAATVNGDAFLVDHTGNRRWWTIPVKAIKFAHGIDMQQLWAEVLTLYRSGEQWWLTDSENKELSRINGDHEQVSPVAELIAETFIFSQKDLDGIDPAKKPLRLNATGVAKALGLAYDKKAVTNEVAEVLRQLTGKKAKPHGKGKYWELQPFPSKAANVQLFAF